MGKKGLLPYRLIVVAFIVVGSFQKIGFVWNASDMFNSLMVIPNVIALIALCKHVKEMQDDFELGINKFRQSK